jgi:hypothetical protein
VPSTFTVKNLADSGPGSLRQAVLDADAQPGPDTIRFAHVLHGTITLTSGELDVTGDLTIQGPGEHRLTVSGNHASRIFDISSGATATITGMTMTDGLANGSALGFASSGGAILDLGTLTLANDVLSDNQAIGDASKSPTGRPGGALGGGVANFGTGTLTISSCAFINNLARGGGIYEAALSVLNVTHGTIEHNLAKGGDADTGGNDGQGVGGGVYNAGGTVAADHTKIKHNHASTSEDDVFGSLS